MGRRLAGGALVGIGLIAASLAWVCLSMTRTVLDPERSEAIAEDVYRDPQVRRQLKDTVAGALHVAIPDAVPVTRPDIAAAADRALHDPVVEEAFIGGLVRSHQRFLGADPRPDEPIVVDGAALAAATRIELVRARPELAGSIPEVPSVEIPLPVDRIPDAGGLRGRLVAATAVLGAAAVGFVSAAFVVTNRRARILRRVGFWLIGAGAFWVVIGTALPALAHLLLPGQAAIIAAIWGVAAGGMRQPSVTAMIAGVAALGLSVIWMAGSALARRTARSRPRSSRHASATPVDEPAWRPPPTPAPAPYVAPTSGPAPGVGDRTVVDRTVVGPAPAPAPAQPHRPSAAPRWVEGVGYVDEAESGSSGRY